jgi:hypothetical protein
MKDASTWVVIVVVELFFATDHSLEFDELIPKYIRYSKYIYIEINNNNNKNPLKFLKYISIYILFCLLVHEHVLILKSSLVVALLILPMKIK